MAALEHNYIQTNGIDLHVAAAGPEDGTGVLFLHGFPEFWYSWQKHLSYFADNGYRAMAPDQRGYNLSDKPKRVKDYKLDELVSDIVGLITASGKETVTLVGHDWGGIVAWHVARQHPELIDKLVILNAPHERAMIKHIRHKPSQLLKSSYILFFQFRGIVEWTLRLLDWKPFTKTMEKSSQKGTFKEADLDQYVSAWLKPRAMSSMLNWYRANGKTFMNGQGPIRVTVPTLVIWGMKDQFLDSDLAHESLAYCDNGKGLLLGEGTHWVHIEETEHVSQRIIDFIEGKQ
ncbi:Pimeloyl-ACP methyl ester carboxylesterase [Alkalibacterium putridalgicola]|uniref:AB hydrolase superfamily protein YfhM n=1 Tax=Alkalibacterium putridalgicola TaxID=426703 RepID=A0A1H7XDE4_9LACT|nr:alpha/beta hydrolase [Alkalibacterium putridalgicola]GEK88645.1 AB hydrolase superfamily protein YfhM [Alkalibacterium putridalgicola]SEM31741.1 Pimeloyl-ACP methyl ester carboxylesterase [Alkalibacterium putridalgicola]